MRQGIGDYQARRRVDNIEVKQQVSQRGGDKHHPGQRELVVEHGAEIAQALLKVSPRPNSGLSTRKICVIPRAQRVRWMTCTTRRSVASLRPAGYRERPTSTPDAETSAPYEHLRSPFRRRNRRSAPAPRDGSPRRSRRKGGVPVVVPLLNRAIEQHPFVGNVASDGEVTFKRVRGIEVVRRLHQSQHRVFQETADGGLQEDAWRRGRSRKRADKLP